MSVTRGLEGGVATESSICSIIDDKLTYSDYTIDDLAVTDSLKEVVYLLYMRLLPNKKQLKTIRQELANEMEVPEGIIEHLRSYDLSTVHPMAALRTAVSMLGLYDDEADVMEKE